MTLAARCPSCRTAFKIPDSILQKQQGLVRCARCSNVFNAFEHAFMPNQDVKTVEKPKVQIFASTAAATPKSAAESSVETSAKNFAAPQDKVQENTFEKNQDAMLKNTISASASTSSSDFMPSPAPAHPKRKTRFEDLDYQPDAVAAIPKRRWQNYSDVALDKINTVFQSVQGIFTSKNIDYRHKQKNTSLDITMRDWHSQKQKQAKWLTNLIAFFLLTFLAMIYWKRDAMVSFFPSTAPIFMKACKVLSCSMAPLKIANNPSVSFSEMEKDMSLTGNRYIMNIGLKNHHDLPVSMPFLEISLFDLNEQLIARRVFHPQEFLKTDDWQRVDKQGMQSGEELPIKIRFQIQQAVSSFKVVAFYP